MITTATPKVHHRSPLRKVAARGANGAPHFPALTIKSAHPLFPPDQVFLWLPGLPGEQMAHCTYNESRDHADSTPVGRRTRRLPVRDANHASYAPPYRVSAESFIAWHTGVTPPFPFHPVPIARTLGAAELEELGRRVHLLATNNADAPSNPLQVLRNSCKCFVLAVLAEMGYLTGPVPRPY